MLKKLGIAIPSLIGVFAIAFFVGPKTNFEPVNTQPIELDIELKDLETFISDRESKIESIKRDNQAQLIWADSLQTKTEYSLLFLHGFSGTHHEANPLHKAFGARYGMNTYLHRIIDHGISDPRAFENLTPSQLIESAKEGIAIAKLLGDKVVIMGCSTGCTYATYLADDPLISHLIYISPNIDLYDTSIDLVTGPWGKDILENVMGGEIRQVAQPPNAAPFWQSEYHINGIIAMQSLMDQTMNADIFSKITQPLYIGTYYKDEENQDFVISVEAARNFFSSVSTPFEDKLFVEFPEAGNHVISSPLKAEAVDKVYSSIFEFGDKYFKVINDSSLIN